MWLRINRTPSCWKSLLLSELSCLKETCLMSDMTVLKETPRTTTNRTSLWDLWLLSFIQIQCCFQWLQLIISSTSILNISCKLTFSSHLHLWATYIFSNLKFWGFVFNSILIQVSVLKYHLFKLESSKTGMISLQIKHSFILFVSTK